MVKTDFRKLGKSRGLESERKLVLMLKRKIGDKVFINPYSNTTGHIIDTKENTQPFNFDYDYLVKFDKPTFFGEFEVKQEYYKDNELDLLQKNWDIIKNQNRLKCNS